MPGRSIPVEIPTLVGSVFLLATLLDRRAAYGRLPQALVAFVVYLWMFATAALLNLASHQLEVLHFFVEMVQLLLLFAMAGLGVGVWLFRSRRKDRS